MYLIYVHQALSLDASLEYSFGDENSVERSVLLYKISSLKTLILVNVSILYNSQFYVGNFASSVIMFLSLVIVSFSQTAKPWDATEKLF